jgi:hypothetical protein
MALIKGSDPMDFDEDITLLWLWAESGRPGHP